MRISDRTLWQDGSTPMRVVARLFALTLGLACGPQVAVPEDEGEADEDEADEEGDGGERPGPGEMYSACSRVSECAPLEFCVFPTREGGFCSDACDRGDDPSPCAPSPGEAVVTCLDIGTPDGRTACALDCSEGSCPNGMSCEAIATPSGVRRDICF
jgi:hypothetical protein